MKPYLFVLGCFVSVLGGFFSWRLANPDVRGVVVADFNHLPVNGKIGTGYIKVGDSQITQRDIDLEYEILTSGIDSEFTSDSALSSSTQDQLPKTIWQRLRNQILISMIERKVLYKVINEQKHIGEIELASKGKCLASWKEILTSAPALFADERQKDSLKVRLCEQQLIDDFMDKVAYRQFEVDEDSMLAYYQENLSSFNVPARVKILHIQLPDERTAKTVRYKVKKNNFRELAKEYSIAPEASKGGEMGPFTKNEVPQFFAEAFKLRRNTISKIVKSTYGFHIFMPIEKYEEKTLDFDEVKDDIKAKLVVDEKKREYQKWLDLALNSVEVRSFGM